MKCTDCGALVKPVVAIDIDGTLGDYHSHFLLFAEAYLDVRALAHKRYEGQERFREWFCMAYGVDVSTFRDIKLAYRQGGLKRTMQVFPQAAQLCDAVRAAGAELWLTTTRPYLRLDAVDPDTREWLRRSKIHYDALLYDEDKYEVLAERVEEGRMVAVLDDLVEQCDEAWHQWGPTVPILRRGYYNSRTYANYPSVDDLKAAAGMITDRVRTWKEQHDG